MSTFKVTVHGRRDASIRKTFTIHAHGDAEDDRKSVRQMAIDEFKALTGQRGFVKKGAVRLASAHLS